MRVGILGNDGSWYVQQLCTAAAARGHQAFPLQFPRMRAELRTGGVALLIDELNLATLDVLIVRTMPPGSLEQVVARMDLLGGLADLGVRIVNSPKALECAVDKYLTSQKLAMAGIPVPDTVVCEDSETALEAFHRLGGDVVVKPLFGAEGRGILRVSHPELALRTFRTLERLNASIYLQRFITGNSEDIRILLLGDHPVASMKRQAAPGDFRANAAQNGTARPWLPTDQELDLAVRAARVTGCEFAGVDLMFDADGQASVIEVNAVPGWRALQKTCAVNVPERLCQWLEEGRLTRD
ncbi:MAG: RimK family alpha-L-glutamate ligase [Fuerstiella sp.]